MLTTEAARRERDRQFLPHRMPASTGEARAASISTEKQHDKSTFGMCFAVRAASVFDSLLAIDSALKLRFIYPYIWSCIFGMAGVLFTLKPPFSSGIFVPMMVHQILSNTEIVIYLGAAVLSSL